MGTDSTASFVVWTAAEVFVTLICIGIPILRPLLARCFPGFWMFSKSTYNKQSGDLDSEGPAVFATHTIGGGVMLGAMPPAEEGQQRLRVPNVRTEVSGQIGNASDESIFLHPDIRRSTRLQRPSTIRTRDDARVEFAPEKPSEC